MIDVARDFERMQDYIVGRMSDEEQRAFEERLVRDPALVLEVERSLRLREGLQQLKIEDYRAHAEQAQAKLRVWYHCSRPQVSQASHSSPGWSSRASRPPRF